MRSGALRALRWALPIALLLLVAAAFAAGVGLRSDLFEDWNVGREPRNDLVRQSLHSLRREAGGQGLKLVTRSSDDAKIEGRGPFRNRRCHSRSSPVQSSPGASLR